MYPTAEDLINACHSQNISIAQITLHSEMEESGLSEKDIRNALTHRLYIMRASAQKALSEPLYSLSGLTGGNAHKMYGLADNESFSGGSIISAMAHALSTSEVNAHMGKIVAAPTAGASGILPAAMEMARLRFQVKDETLVDALLVASAIGNIIVTNATVSGAEGGCQVECGSAAAMAAGALVSLKTQTPEPVFHAASIALINVMGLVCDPVGGLVEFPCALRNAGGVTNAMTAADLALAGIESLVPFDEVVDAMYQVGRSLPMQLRETALGGVATQPSAQCACKRCRY